MEEKVKVEDKALEEEFDPYLMTPEQRDEFIQKAEVSNEPDKEEEAPEPLDKPIETPAIPDNSEPAKPTETSEPTKMILTQEMLDGMNLNEDAMKLINSKGLVGKPMSEFVNQYVNAQKLVGKKAEEVHRELFPQDSPEKAPVIFSKDLKKEEAEAKINDLVLAKVKREAKDLGLSEDFEFPPTLDVKSEEYKHWYKDANYDYPADLKLFERALSEEKDGLVKAHNEVVRLRSEYKQENDNLIDDDILQITKHYGQKNIDLKSLGYEFNDDLISSLIFVEKDGKKTLDNSMFNWVNGEIPIMEKGALARKFVALHNPEIIGKVQESALIQGRKEGAEIVTKKPINKGLGNTQVSGELSSERAGTEKDPYAMTIAELDAEIARSLREA